MSWFEEQLQYRAQSDNADFADAIDSIANAVMGTRLRDALSQDEIAGSAIEEILKYYHCKTKGDPLPPQVKTLDEQIEYRMRPFGIKSRSVTLDQGWYRHAVGAMLGTLKDGTQITDCVRTAGKAEKFPSQAGYSRTRWRHGERARRPLRPAAPVPDGPEEPRAGTGEPANCAR